MGSPSSPDSPRRNAAAAPSEEIEVRRGPLRLIKRTVDKAWWDNIFSECAAAAFWQTLSLPPLLLGLLGSLGYLGDWFGPEIVDAVHDKILAFSRSVFTESVVDQIIGPTVNDILTRGKGEVASAGFLISLWAGSSALASLVDSITLAYNQYLVRNSIWQRIFALLLYLVALILAVIGLPVVALGPEWLPTVFPPFWQDDITWLIQGLYYPATGIALVLALATLYKLSLPRKLPWHRGLPGALLAMVIFLVSSYGLRVYVSWITSTGYTYGALATPIFFLLFAFFIGFAIIMGAQFNNAIQEMWPAKMTRRERRRWRRLEMRRLHQRIHTEEGYRAWQENSRNAQETPEPAQPDRPDGHDSPSNHDSPGNGKPPLFKHKSGQPEPRGG